MNTILIKNIEIDGEIKDVFISDTKIVKIAESLNVVADEVIDGKNCALMPSFVNMHTHTSMGLMRGCEEDLPLFEWLQRIWAIEDNLTPEMIYWGCKLACVEMIKTGTTAFNDMYWNSDVAAKAVVEMGIRGFHSSTLLDAGSEVRMVEDRERVMETFEKSKQWSELNQFLVGVHANYTVQKKNILWAKEFAVKNNLKLHIHLAETEKEGLDSIEYTGVSPTKYLDQMGILDENVIAAHCVWLNDEDIEILGKRKVTVVHNVNSNLKLASGYKFKMQELIDAGANVTIGTDGPATSNNLDILEASKIAALLQKAWRKDPTAMPLDTILQVSSANGFKALGIDAGRIEEGAVADLNIVDLSSAFFVPRFNFKANFVYSAPSSSIKTVICNGKIVMKDRKIAGEDEIIRNADLMARKLNKK